VITDLVRVIRSDGKIIKSGTTDIPRCFWCGVGWSIHDTGSQCPYR